MFGGPIDAGGDESKAVNKPEKIIHEPSQDDLAHIRQLLTTIDINPADRVLLIWGRKVFEEDWISDQTNNWLATLDHDTEKYYDSCDDQDQRIFAIMVELDYKALQHSLYMDAMQASAIIEDGERSKVGRIV